MQLETKWLPDAKAVDFFQENGYFVTPPIIPEERLVRLRDHMERIFRSEFETGKAPLRYWQPGDNGRGIRQADNAFWADLTIRGLATDPLLGEIAAKLMHADSIRLWHDKLFYKPARGPVIEGNNVGWHQDYYYWTCSDKPSLLTAWVAFDDVSIEKGCVQVVPRSHRWGLYDEASDFFGQDLDGLSRQWQPPAGEKFEPVKLVMKAGQVSFHHCLTIHGSGPNLTDQPRRAMSIHLMTGDTRYKPGTSADKHMMIKLMHPTPGEPFSGEHVPLVWSAK